MKFKEPTEEQLKAMEEFASICSKAMEMIMLYEPNFILNTCSIRLQEAMGHFHSYIINDGKLLPKSGELLLKSPQPDILN